jgi:3-oxoacyl-[acyl-carrier protein] reductase
MWERDFAVNLFGTMNCAKAVVPGMVSRKYGKIINFSSTAAKMGAPNSYSAAKAAIQAFTRGLATEFGPSGINVNAIAPGMVRTKLFAAVSKEIENRLFENAAALTPLRRNQTIDDIANAVAFLASDLSKNITGQCLEVDSGMVML